MALDEVSLDKAAQFVIGKPLIDLSDTERATLRVICSWTTEAISTYLKGSPCPEPVREMATLRLLYYDWHTRYARRPADGGMLEATIPARCSVVATARIGGYGDAQSAQGALSRRSRIMIELGIAGGPPVERHNYTSLHVAAAEQYAEFGLHGAMVGAVEIAARLFQAAFQVATVSPSIQALSPALLGTIARRLITSPARSCPRDRRR